MSSEANDQLQSMEIFSCSDHGVSKRELSLK